MDLLYVPAFVPSLHIALHGSLTGTKREEAFQSERDSGAGSPNSNRPAIAKPSRR
jgi:hypothetical protein